MSDVAAEDQRKSAGVTGEAQPEDGTKAAEVGTGFSERVGIAGGVENEFREVGVGTELTVFGALEGSSA